MTRLAPPCTQGRERQSRPAEHHAAHDSSIRHSAATLMLVNGAPLKVVSDVLGHASVAITGDVYGIVSPDVSRTALAALSIALET